MGCGRRNAYAFELCDDSFGPMPFWGYQETPPKIVLLKLRLFGCKLSFGV